MPSPTPLPSPPGRQSSWFWAAVTSEATQPSPHHTGQCSIAAKVNGPAVLQRRPQPPPTGPRRARSASRPHTTGQVSAERATISFPMATIPAPTPHPHCTPKQTPQSPTQQRKAEHCSLPGTSAGRQDSPHPLAPRPPIACLPSNQPTPSRKEVNTPGRHLHRLTGLQEVSPVVVQGYRFERGAGHGARVQGGQFRVNDSGNGFEDVQLGDPVRGVRLDNPRPVNQPVE